MHEGGRLLLHGAILNGSTEYDGDTERVLRVSKGSRREWSAVNDIGAAASCLCSVLTRVASLGAWHLPAQAICSVTKQCTTELLASFKCDAARLGVTPAHLMGEALELLTAHAYVQRGTITVRDYLAEDKRRRRNRRKLPAGDAADGTNDDRDDPHASLFVSCAMHKVFISSAPRCSPFYMRDEDDKELLAALEVQARGRQATFNKASILHAKLKGHMRSDFGIDVLVWLKEEGISGKSHFLVVQCKARADFEVRSRVGKFR